MHNTTKPKLSVGQKLWYVPDYYNNQGREVTVTKVGRKWASILKYKRINIKTLFVHNTSDSSVLGRCYLSEADYKQEIEREKAWDSLTILFRRILPPPHLTFADMARIRAIVTNETIIQKAD